MKIIKLFLLLTFGLWAEFRLDISKDIQVSQLESIVKNGWNDSNKTLNRLIVSEAERLMPEILEKIKKPVLKGVVTKDDPYPISRILLTRDDNFFILTYCKYLEFKNDTDSALNLYIKSLEGLNTIPPSNLLNMIYHLVIEEMIVTNLKKNVNYISKLEYQKMEKILILNIDFFRDALEEDQRIAVEVMGLNNKVPKNILRLLHKYSVGYIKAYTAIKNKKELIKFKKIFNEQTKNIEAKYNNWIEKNIISDDIDKDKLIASYLFIVSLPKLNLIEDVWGNIDRNKKLLNTLH